MCVCRQAKPPIFRALDKCEHCSLELSQKMCGCFARARERSSADVCIVVYSHVEINYISDALELCDGYSCVVRLFASVNTHTRASHKHLTHMGEEEQSRSREVMSRQNARIPRRIPRARADITHASGKGNTPNGTARVVIRFPSSQRTKHFCSLMCCAYCVCVLCFSSMFLRLQ